MNEDLLCVQHHTRNRLAFSFKVHKSWEQRIRILAESEWAETHPGEQRMMKLGSQRAILTLPPTHTTLNKASVSEGSGFPRYQGKILSPPLAGLS